MGMSKKDYEIVASVLNDLIRQNPDERGLGLAVLGLADRFEKENPRFLRSRFEQAALLGPFPKCTACGRPKWATSYCTVTDDGRHP